MTLQLRQETTDTLSDINYYNHQLLRGKLIQLNSLNEFWEINLIAF